MGLYDHLSECTKIPSTRVPPRTIQSDKGSPRILGACYTFPVTIEFLRLLRTLALGSFTEIPKGEKNLSQWNFRVWLLSNNLISDDFTERLPSCKEPCQEHTTSWNEKRQRQCKMKRSPWTPNYYNKKQLKKYSRKHWAFLMRRGRMIERAGQLKLIPRRKDRGLIKERETCVWLDFRITIDQCDSSVLSHENDNVQTT